MRLRYLAFLVRQVFWLGDTAGIRLLMAGASVMIATLFLAYPGVFDRLYFSLLGRVAREMSLEPATFWAALFFIHGIGVAWRFWDQSKRIIWALAINWLGWVLWTLEIILTNVAMGEVNPGNALEIPAVMALTIALLRTGLNDEKWTP